MLQLTKTQLKSFEAKVDKAVIGCWEWTAGKDIPGYGKFMANGETLKSHRVAYELYKGPIPNGLMVRHLCNNPGCQNPKHLDVGTAKDNFNDMKIAGRFHPPKGSKDGMSKLKECDIPFIRSSPLSGSHLAKMFGVSRTNINRIKKRQRWGHIP